MNSENPIVQKRGLWPDSDFADHGANRKTIANFDEQTIGNAINIA
jgi:hypothetical protein